MHLKSIKKTCNQWGETKRCISYATIERTHALRITKKVNTIRKNMKLFMFSNIFLFVQKSEKKNPNGKFNHKHIPELDGKKT